MDADSPDATPIDWDVNAQLEADGRSTQADLDVDAHACGYLNETGDELDELRDAL